MIEILDEVATQKIASQLFDIGKTLQSWVHVAGVAKILQSNKACFLPSARDKVFELGWTLFAMLGVHFHAFFWTVCDKLTSANSFQHAGVSTSGAEPQHNFLIVEDYPFVVGAMVDNLGDNNDTTSMNKGMKVLSVHLLFLFRMDPLLGIFHLHRWGAFRGCR